MINFALKRKVFYIVFGFVIIIPLLLYSFTRNQKQNSFSIIVCSYNYGQFIEKTIQSVLQQTHKNFELILVNDGSTDNTLEIMQKYALKDKRIKIINQENQGLSMARNNAMNIATGDYLWFVDADDFIIPNALHLLNRKINNNDEPDLISFYVQNFIDDKVILTYLIKLPDEVWKFRFNKLMGKDLSIYVLKSYPVTSGQHLYKRNFIKKHNIKFIPKIKFEDDIFFHTSLQANAHIAVLRKAIYMKRAHPKSIVANRDKYYDSITKLPIHIYEETLRVGKNEEMSRNLFTHYVSMVFDRYPNDKKFIPDIEALITWLKQQPENKFWIDNTNKLQKFVNNKIAE